MVNIQIKHIPKNTKYHKLKKISKKHNEWDTRNKNLGHHDL